MLARDPSEAVPGGIRLRLLRVEPSPRTFITLLSLLAGVWLLSRLVAVILVLLGALIIAGAMAPAVEWLEARRVRRGLAIALVFAGLLVATVLFVTLTIPSLIAQASSLMGREPALRARLALWLAGSPSTSPLAELLTNVRSGDLIRAAATGAITFSARIVAVFAYIMSSVILALYIMVDRDRLRGGLFLLVPRTHHVRLARVMLNLETIVGGYIRGQAITSAFMAVFVFLLLKACGVQSALPIAVFAGAADVLPYTGALLSVGAATAAALSGGPLVTSIVFAVMVAYEEFESRVIVPRVYGRALRLPSSVIFVALLAGGVLYGMAGALFALPVAAALLMLVEELRVELPGQQEQAADVETRVRDERGEKEYERRAEGMPAQMAAAIAVEISLDRHLEENGPVVRVASPRGEGQD